MSIRKATAEWRGNLREGKGNLSTDSGVLKNTEYNFISRFENGAATNPEELIGAAHAGCFTMWLSSSAAKEGYKVNLVRTEARVHLDKVNGGSEITKIELVTNADIEGIDKEKFQKLANDAKNDCIISKALKSVNMTLTATLKGS